MRQSWSGMARAGDEITFTSVLLPHSPVIRPSQLLDPPVDSADRKRIEIPVDTDAVTVVKAVVENSPRKEHRHDVLGDAQRNR